MTEFPIIDTHCHLDSKSFHEDQADVIRRAQDDNIVKIVNIGVDNKTNNSSFSLAQQYPGYIYSTVGAHPVNVERLGESEMQQIQTQLETHNPVAIGEIGLDYYYDTDRRVQKKVFVDMLDYAVAAGKPVVIHNREADEDMLAVLSDYASRLTIVLHSYLSGPDYVDNFLQLGCYFGIGGPLTFKSGQPHRDAVKLIPLSNLLLETDAPWLTPHPYRGKRNEPSYTRITAQKIADEKQVEIEALCLTTCENANKVFSLI